MKIDLIPPIVEVAHSERRAIIPLGIPVDWNCLSREEVAWARAQRVADQPSVMASADADWGEHDSLANIPRATKPAWVRAATTRDDGDE